MYNVQCTLYNVHCTCRHVLPCRSVQWLFSPPAWDEVVGQVEPLEAVHLSAGTAGHKSAGGQCGWVARHLTCPGPAPVPGDTDRLGRGCPALHCTSHCRNLPAGAQSGRSSRRLIHLFTGAGPQYTAALHCTALHCTALQGGVQCSAGVGRPALAGSGLSSGEESGRPPQKATGRPPRKVTADAPHGK